MQHRLECLRRMIEQERDVRKLVIALGLAAAAGLSAQVAPAQENTAAAPAPAPAANVCTGKVEAECGNTTGCSWLQGYKVANGVEVPGYCRLAPKPLTARRRAPTGATAQ